MPDMITGYEEVYPGIWLWGSGANQLLRFVVAEDTVYVRAFSDPESVLRRAFLAHFPEHRVVDVDAGIKRAELQPLWRVQSVEEFLKHLYREYTK